MIDSRVKLTVLHDDNSVFSDKSDDAVDYQRDPFTTDLSSTEDYLYIGYHKPFNAVYSELTTANTNINDFACEIYDGTAWVAVELHDESRGFTRSGFLAWDSADMEEVEINSITKHYIRLRPSVDHSATTHRGLNLILSDDQMLTREFPEILDVQILPPGETTHINSHVSSRERIVQKIRNAGYIKRDAAGIKQQLTHWDILDIYEFRQASAYLTLSKIFFNLSDSPEDTWWSKYLEYQDQFERQFARATSSLDLDDDGVKDSGENARPTRTIRLIK